MFKHHQQIVNSNTFVLESGWRYAIIKASFLVPAYNWGEEFAKNEYLSTNYLNLTNDSNNEYSNHNNTLFTTYTASNRTFKAGANTKNKIYLIDILYLK